MCSSQNHEFHSFMCVLVREPLDSFDVIKWLNNMQINNVSFVMDSKTTNDTFDSNKPDVLEFGHTTFDFIHSSQTLRWSSTDNKQRW